MGVHAWVRAIDVGRLIGRLSRRIESAACVGYNLQPSERGRPARPSPLCTSTLASRKPSCPLPPSPRCSRSPTERFFAAARIGAARRQRRRSRVQHGDDRLSGNPHRSLVRRADRHADVSAHRQHRRQSAKTSNPDESSPPAWSFATCRVSRRTGAARSDLVVVSARRRRRRHQRHRHAQAHADPAREGRAERLPDRRRTSTSAMRWRVHAPRRRWRASISPRSSAARRPIVWHTGTWALGSGYRAAPTPRFHVVAYDFGIKHNILRMLATRGCRLTVVPAQTSAHEVLALKPDGVFLSNGPGDPEPCAYAISAIRELLARRDADVRHLPRPPAARSRLRRQDAQDEVRPSRREPSGARQGHADRCLITSQNHGFAVDAATLPANVRVTHVSLFDGSLQGVALTDRPAFSFQGHPEASPGPHDLAYLFDRFIRLMEWNELARAPSIATDMPKRTDIQSILIIGAGPIVIGQACEFDYSGAQACKALREEGYKVILVNSNPATIMTDPEMADVTYIEPITWPMIAKIIERERPDALLPTMGGQTALNCALDLAREGVLTRFDVELIGATRKAIDKAEDRAKFKAAMTRNRTRLGALGHRARPRAGAGGAGGHRLSCGDPAVVHARRHRRRHRLQQGRVRRDVQARARSVADARAADRGVAARLERVRDGGRPRQEGQLHHRVLDREPRPDGRAHRRLDHGCAGADADRQGIPDHARRVDRGAARDRRRHGRIERAVRDQSRRRTDDRHRDESARVAFVRARVESDRLSDRQGRRQARGRLHARRTAQRHHRAWPTRRRRSSRPSTTSSPRSRASPSKNSSRPTTALRRR